MKTLDILFQDQNLVVIDKPSGFHVHPPELNAHKVPREKVILYLLRDQIKQRVFPVHRLDAGTSGVLVFALSSEIARVLSDEFSARRVTKTYWAFVRGHLAECGLINLPLLAENKKDWLESETEFKTLRQCQLNAEVGTRYSSARYSWLEVHPKTGRFHQIRRHMNRISHPVIGDAEHGDSRHNRFFREKLGISGLCLRASGLSFPSLGYSWTCESNELWDALLML